MLGGKALNSKSKDTLIVGLALFAMFFGAGNLIFPPTLGLLSGDKWFPAMLGFMLTGIGFPVIGVIATAKAGGHIEDLGDRVGKVFSKTLGLLIMLSIGPLLAIPRTAATTYEIGLRPLPINISPAVGSIIFFAIVLYFVLTPSKLIDRIGGVLTPVLIIVLTAMLVKSFIDPIGVPTDVNAVRTFKMGFEEGYQTMDAIGSIILTIVVIEGIKSKGYLEHRTILSMTIIAGIISAIGLSLVYGGFVYVGATTSSVVSSDMTRIELLNFIARSLWGSFGAIVLGIAVALACLTTAIGLTATVGAFFSELTKNKISYNAMVIGISVFSAVMATIGVDSIVSIAVPILVTIYPMTLVLIVMSLFDRFLNRASYIGAVLGAFIIGAIQGISYTVPKVAAILNAYFGHSVSYAFTNFFAVSKDFMNSLPFAELGFAWLVPSLLLGLIFRFVSGFIYKSNNVTKSTF